MRNWNSAPTDLTVFGTNTETSPEMLLSVKNVPPLTVLPISTNKLVAIWLDKPVTKAVLRPLVLQPHKVLQFHQEAHRLEDMAALQAHLLAQAKLLNAHLPKAHAHVPLEQLVLQDPLEPMETMATTELQDPTAITGPMHPQANNHLLLTSASIAHQDPLDLLETLDLRDQTDNQAHPEMMEHQDQDLHQDPLDPQDQLEAPETLDNQDLPDNQEPSVTYQELQAPPDQLDLQDPPEEMANQEAPDQANLDPQDLPETKDHQDQTEMLDHQEAPEVTENQDRAAVAIIVHHPELPQVIKPTASVCLLNIDNKHKFVAMLRNLISSYSLFISFKTENKAIH